MEKMIWDFNYTGNYLAFMFSVLFADESKLVAVKSEYFHGFLYWTSSRINLK